MPTPHAHQPDYDAIAFQAYEWLKKRRTKRKISTIEVLMKINGYKWGENLEDEFARKYKSLEQDEQKENKGTRF